MLGLFRRAPAVRGGSRGRAVLRLEGLERRDHPSGSEVPPPPETVSADCDIAPPPDPATGDPIPAQNLPPEIEDFYCEEMGNGLFLITGRVVDDSPGGLTVTLGGSTSADGQTTTTASDGTFSMTVQLRVDGTDSGWVTATTVDTHGEVSEEVAQFVSPTPP